MTLTLAAATIWVFAYVDTVLGVARPLVGGYAFGLAFATEAECRSKLPTYDLRPLVCVRIP